MVVNKIFMCFIYFFCIFHCKNKARVDASVRSLVWWLTSWGGTFILWWNTGSRSRGCGRPKRGEVSSSSFFFFLRANGMFLSAGRGYTHVVWQGPEQWRTRGHHFSPNILSSLSTPLLMTDIHAQFSRAWSIPLISLPSFFLFFLVLHQLFLPVKTQKMPRGVFTMLFVMMARWFQKATRSLKKNV